LPNERTSYHSGDFKSIQHIEKKTLDNTSLI